MNYIEATKSMLNESSKTWLITGVAGFVGSNLLENLLNLNQNVIGLDNFSTGYKENLIDVSHCVGSQKWKHFRFIEGDIRDFATCTEVCKNIDIVLHQAALGSVPRSMLNPIVSNENNVTGFLNMITAARHANVHKFIYAASSSTYGDSVLLPKSEKNIGSPLSPYAVTKYVNELYADVFSRCYSFHSTGLRYFNVFGKRQDPNGAYAAVIPKWIASMIQGDDININGDGTNSRDFCYIENVVQANILAALSPNQISSVVYNVAVGDRTDLNSLFEYIRESLSKNNIIYSKDPIYGEARKGDVLHSQADISLARECIGYQPNWRVRESIDATVHWYLDKLFKNNNLQ